MVVKEIFKGKTKPHYCLLTGGKKYLFHGNGTLISYYPCSTGVEYEMFDNKDK